MSGVGESRHPTLQGDSLFTPTPLNYTDSLSSTTTAETLISVSPRLVGIPAGSLARAASLHSGTSVSPAGGKTGSSSNDKPTLYAAYRRYIEACRSGNVTDLKIVLQMLPDTVRKTEFVAGLFFAVQAGHAEAVRLLVHDRAMLQLITDDKSTIPPVPTAAYVAISATTNNLPVSTFTPTLSAQSSTGKPIPGAGSTSSSTSLTPVSSAAATPHQGTSTPQGTPSLGPAKKPTPDSKQKGKRKGAESKDIKAASTTSPNRKGTSGEVSSMEAKQGAPSAVSTPSTLSTSASTSTSTPTNHPSLTVPPSLGMRVGSSVTLADLSEMLSTSPTFTAAVPPSSMVAANSLLRQSSLGDPAFPLDIPSAPTVLLRLPSMLQASDESPAASIKPEALQATCAQIVSNAKNDDGWDPLMVSYLEYDIQFFFMYRHEALCGEMIAYMSDIRPSPLIL